jgi:hypothetical protein
MGAEGKGDSVDRQPAPSDDGNEAPESNRPDFNGYNIDGVYGESFVQWDRTSVLTARPRFTWGEANQVVAAEPKSLTGRTDIDTAMVEALRSALASDPGPPGPAWAASEQDQLGDVRRSADLVALTWGPPELARRCDIDLAMLDALRHAMGPDPEVPGA